MGSDLVTSHHLARRAVIYVRQSTPHQVLTNQESLRLQYALQQRARSLGWHEAAIEVVDADLGLSGASTAGREGFKDLVARVALGEVGLIPLDRGHAARTELLGLVPAARPLRPAWLPDRGPRRSL